VEIRCPRCKITRILIDEKPPSFLGPCIIREGFRFDKIRDMYKCLNCGFQISNSFVYIILKQNNVENYIAEMVVS